LPETYVDVYGIERKKDSWGDFVQASYASESSMKESKAPPVWRGLAVPAELAKVYFKEMIGFLKRNMYTEEKNPAEMTGLAMMGLVGSVPGGPAMGDVASLGMVKRARGAGPAIRELMKKEMKSRGEPLGSVEGDVASLVDFVARGPWFHGRKTYPKPGESFAGARIGSGNLGEPRGLSLTADVRLLERNFAQTPEKQHRVKDKLLDAHAKLYAKSDEFKTDKDWRIISKLESKLDELASGKPFSRVFPRFEGTPSEKILPAWKGPGTEAAQGVLKESYTEALKRQPELFLPRLGDVERGIAGLSKTDQKLAKIHLDEMITSPGYIDSVPDTPGGLAAKQLYQQMKNAEVSTGLRLDWRRAVNQTKLNQDISEILQEKGYKALLYSTARGGYREFELRVLNPKDVTMLDIRKHKDPGIERLTKGEAVTHRTKPEFLGRQTRRIQTWEKATEQYPASLRDIYQDIDLEKIVLDAERGK